MNRLTNNDRNLGPFTLARWTKIFAAHIDGGCNDDQESHILIVAFGWAVRLRIPLPIKPFGKYHEHNRRYGVSFSDMGNGYDFLQVFFGPQTHDSSTTKSWSKHLPWKQWTHVRHSLYTPTGQHFYTEVRGGDFGEYWDKKEQCPKSYFLFEDYDGARITAACTINEREWHKGEGWFKWLRWFSAPKIKRSLDISFSAEVGPEKGSWKGGTIGHAIEMLPRERPEGAFRRYCEINHARKGRHFRLKFIGECPRPSPEYLKSNPRML